jgi:hypothetical protein
MGCEVLIAVYGMTRLPRPAFAFRLPRTHLGFVNCDAERMLKSCVRQVSYKRSLPHRGASCRVRVTTGAKPSCFYRLPRLQKIRWFQTAAACWRRNTKASLLCLEMTNPRRHWPGKAVILKRTHKSEDG